jgi:heme/copper-type cytochrome/quinol oxidase subunit 2
MWFLKLCAMVVAGFMIKYRERIGDTVGNADWMKYVGGVYNLIVISAVFIFFWSIASLTGTTDIFFAPLFFLVGGAFQ